MDILFFLIPISLAIAFLGVLGIIWCLKNKQFQNLDKEAVKILFPDKNKQD
jgi:cbb3-type cytochrome oxidase maturation protein